MKKNRSLLVGAIVFLLVILIGFISSKSPEHPYQLSVDETLTQVLALEDEVFPEDIQYILEDSSTTIFVDVREPSEYVKGHIEGAVNIPTHSITKEEYLPVFMDKDSAQQVIIYGKDQLQANGPWLVLKQLGAKNIKVLLGGYHYYANNSLDPYDMPPIPEYLVEEPKYDYQSMVEETPGLGDVTVDIDGPQKVIPVRKKKARKIEGGC